ncbi:MAG TPA: DUF1573 domain-containing protein [Patescibacteria group bacterium]
MKIKNPILLLTFTTLLLILGSAFIFGMSQNNSPQIISSENAKAELVEGQNFDWGKIDYSGKKATKTFTIKNVGKDVLKLYNIRTSCMCTNVYLTIDGVNSPEFGMDMGSSISSYTGEIKPKDKAKLTVVFDPSYHGPQGIGPVTRYVEVDTNDKSNPKLTFTLTGVVVNDEN